MALAQILPDLDSRETIQTTSVHLHLPLCLLSSCGCETYKLSSPFVVLILSFVSRVLTLQEPWCPSARTTAFNSHSFRTPISDFRRRSHPPPGKPRRVIAPITGADAVKQHARLLVYPEVLENTHEEDGKLHTRLHEPSTHKGDFSSWSRTS